MKKIIVLFIFSACSLFGQETFPTNGITNQNKSNYAFTNAILIVNPETTIEKATLLISNGKIIDVGKSITPPDGFVVVDLAGNYIYPSFIDIYTQYGIEEAKRKKENNPGPQMFSSKSGAFGWNEAVKPEVNGADLFSIDNKEIEEWLKAGFGAVLTHQLDGIVRGTATFTLLGKESENKSILKREAASLYSFSKGVSRQDYPSSLMGSIALLKQTYHDAYWYKNGGNKLEENISLDEFNSIQDLPQIFEVRDVLSIPRADKIGDEFGKQYIIKGSGNEYQKIDLVKSAEVRLIIPINFPDAFDVEDPFDAELVSLEAMKHWELAPLNPMMLDKAGIEFAITSLGTKSKNEFWTNLRKSINLGFNKKTALKALTTIPAKLINSEEMAGTLDKGKIANFLITSGDIFDESTQIYQNWVAGKPTVLASFEDKSLAGNFELTFNGFNYDLEIESKDSKLKSKVTFENEKAIPAKINYGNELVTLSFSDSARGYFRLNGIFDSQNRTFKGKGQDENGKWFSWSAKFKNEIAKQDKNEDNSKESEEYLSNLGEITYPFLPYGKTNFNANNNYLIKNAMVWTMENDEAPSQMDVLIKNGKISEVGKNLPSTDGVPTFDAEGKHLTPGIIDEHSHLAITRGGNESGLASSAEVNIGDILNSDHINIYRQLAGGVTTVQVLHGSANPIGGKAALIKLRWGKSADEMKFENADGFIKFALGENVKQSNWGSDNKERYPQTRMGVEQFYIERFTRAKEYEESWERYNKLSDNEKKNIIQPRKDLELETLVEILNSERFITCHSYVQSEINMLMKVAEKFGFKVNTFTHILEGYKVADKMLEHGAAGSSFSDWWAYKFEVNDAIPFNAAIMTKVGINTAINSDDAEMARRLNQEAAKSIKYGGMSEIDALKMVTLNPAKMLHIDNKVGSIKVGKDADLVIWSDNPLSVYAIAEKTFIDGIIYFDREEEKILQESIGKERARLIQKMLSVKKSGGKTQKPKKEEQIEYHCDTIINFN
ncbi:MAG: amidohydrolase family protein [Melioribacteraceae bacterium]|nr:amidohydrolase family protein [Melioribacteraceae bacterium]